MPFLFFVQVTAESQELLEKFVDISAFRIVGLDQFLLLRENSRSWSG